ncbi:MAG: hypothetical protein INR68_18570, partial [Methylobacterium mesophilicum]|nr:hypothetical protein [Methylobacterium mesophilicum]
MSDEPSRSQAAPRAAPMPRSSDQDPPPAGALSLAGDHLLVRTGVEGVYARTELHETLTGRLRAYIARWRPAGAETLAIPPLMSRSVVERSGYVTSFPNLLGCVCALHSADAQRVASADQGGPGANWTEGLRPTDFVLTPAACYPIYPLVAARGALPRGGLTFDVEADCFRNEASTSLSRLRSFRMREFVCLGAFSDVAAFRDAWIARALDMAGELALPARVEPANDP